MKILFALLFSACSVLAEGVTLHWDASPTPDVTYVLSYGVGSGDYTTSQDVGAVLTIRVEGLLPGQTYYFSVRAKDENGLSVPANELSYLVPPVVVVDPLPPPWKSENIGSGTGSAFATNGTFFVTGSGNLGGKADSYVFSYQPLSGAGDISAQVLGLSESGSNRRAGVMIRESLASNSRYLWCGLDDDLKVRVQRRTATGGRTAASTYGSAMLPGVWVRLVRTNDLVTAFHSTNGVAWVKLSSLTVAMAANIHAGLAVASGTSSATTEAVFSKVQVTP